jgi:hypothetical protein
MRPVHLLCGAALVLTSAWAIAQEGPESLLPPGFDQPERPAAAPRPAPVRGPAAAQPSVPRPAGNTASAPAGTAVAVPPLPTAAAGAPASAVKVPTLAELEKLSPDDLEEALGLKPKFDIPAAARRSMRQVGVIDSNEGGLAPASLAGQDAGLVRALLAKNNGMLVSRWGHILMRRALASRLDAPSGMQPADFAALRAGLLVRMGEGDAARAIVQDVDTANYSPELATAALDSFVATADFTGICPASIVLGGTRKEPQWQVAQSLCAAFRGDGNAALSQLDRALSRGIMPKIDLLLAQKYAGAAGKARRAVKIEWDDVEDMTPWRYGLALAVGLKPPEALMKAAGPRYAWTSATAPMLGLTDRAAAADQAAGAGILSSAAMVDLYSQIYASQDISGPWAERATALRDAYVAATPADRLVAMQKLWGSADGDAGRFSRSVLTAYAAARLPVDPGLAEGAPDVIASMLTAGLDRNAMLWAGAVEEGSQGWALLTLVAPIRTNPVEAGAVSRYLGNDSSPDSRKSAFLLAGLAGLGRLSPQALDELSSELEVDLKRQSRWSQMIGAAADAGNPALVALLAGVGMQGDGWSKMTPRHLYHIVSALNRVGLDAEARMIAAEAVARG